MAPPRTIAITMGDPAGIGAEVVLKALQERAPDPPAAFYVFGDGNALMEHCRALGLPFELPVISLEAFRRQAPGETCLVDFANVHGRLQFGVERSDYGRASMEYIEEAVFGCMSGRLDALITAPINKKSIHLAGFDFPGHTEFLAALTHTPRVVMSFHACNFWSVLTSTHVPLADAVGLVKKGRIVDTIELAHRELTPYVAEPAIAVASLNPHGAEGGLFGMEEGMEIVPAVAECAARGLPVKGPFPADTVYLRALQGDFNIVVNHYHDQGMIPVKLLSFGKAVNVTLGLPFLRASVDHGTAFDIAGRGVASPESMLEACRLTLELLDRRGPGKVDG
ncbi:MAG TPA: 4-hydroxythreonine-4-phosphate dehydrogenase PdxA [Acidobacteriota bacterium]|nr:4-hydroxythreonine-4-phosphate dehydrogenase PdxA [Acidobacteriota bacterium]HQG93175.1 4-hydroxythreonine-4-phosphate dehydrogenase PdxA [Acidobacteriota bacterium]HQK87729.1 4-hydroxythreonine-4-phosphate dehydrogenase PdxA [Acidobacteriota bacterium]